MIFVRHAWDPASAACLIEINKKRQMPDIEASDVFDVQVIIRREFLYVASIRKKHARLHKHFVPVRLFLKQRFCIPCPECFLCLPAM